MLIKLFTHSDVDGLGCVAVAKHHFMDLAVVEWTVCGYGTVDHKVRDYLVDRFEQYPQPEVVYITDISVNAETAEMLDRYHKEHANIQLIDHHKSALWLNKYDWAEVTVETEDGKLASGTSLLHAHLKGTLGALVSAGGLHTPPEQNMEALDDFAEQVRLYDTWEWDERNLAVPQQLNDLFALYGFDRFVERFGKNPEVTFDGLERSLVKRTEYERNNYIKHKREQVYVTNVRLSHMLPAGAVKVTDELVDAYGAFADAMGDVDPIFSLGIVMVERFHSEVGNALAKDGIDVVMLLDIQRDTISLRTTRNDVMVDALAQLNGGGGHAKSAGAPMSEAWLQFYLRKYLEKRSGVAEMGGRPL